MKFGCLMSVTSLTNIQLLKGQNIQYSGSEPQSLSKKKTALLTKARWAKLSRPWFFNLAFVPCHGPQEDLLMGKISCVFHMQDTYTVGIWVCILYDLTMNHERNEKSHTWRCCHLNFIPLCMYVIRSPPPIFKSVVCGFFLLIMYYPVCNFSANLWRKAHLKWTNMFIQMLGTDLFKPCWLSPSCSP